MKSRRISAVLVLVWLLQSSSLASSVTKTFTQTPEQVFAAAEKALREDSRVISVEPSHNELKIRFSGPRFSWGEHYSALAGDASISLGVADKCQLTISVQDVSVSSASPVIPGPSSKSFANSLLRRVRRILGQ